ncbi:sensor histidine kinase [Anaerovorax odorimutans]|uniref:sensor histidine kinase n=1 Tax=Anaerovorax odorimutans TaxID=109327 RepID=UPI0004248CE5|nr:GHKL domain-containing protein [Anaerovorax odorimutans]
MPIYICFCASAIESFTLYFIRRLLDKENSMPYYKIAIYVIVAALATTIADRIHMPFQFMFSVIMDIVLLSFLTKRKINILLLDIINSCSINIFVEFIATIIIGHFYGNILGNYYLLFFMLFLYSAIFYFAGKNEIISKKVQKFYLKYREIIVWISLNVFFSIFILLHLWDDLDEVFWGQQWNLFFLVIIIYVSNVILLISICVRKKQEEKISAYQEYGEYLEEMMQRLSSRQHEFANQINVMMGFAQIKKGENLSKSILEYGERILDEKKQKENNAIICDDSMIAAMLYRKKTQAEKEQIDFETMIEKPFPDYPVSPYDLVELIVNLINNAFEAVAGLDTNERKVFLKMNKGIIEVINTIPENFEDSSIVKLSKLGYSTKGNQRGYGLSNIKTIIGKYNGNLDICRQDNMIIFTVLFP